MKACVMNVRLVATILLFGFLIGVCGGSAQAQTITVSPTDLSFGVPTGTPSPFTSAPQPIIVNVSSGDSGSLTIGVSKTGANASDFTITGNSCTGTITPPTTCQITVTFTASLAPASTLESATLTITNSLNGDNTIAVPMNGAFGAIELFAALNVNPSLFAGVTWPASAGNPVKTETIKLSCPATPMAILSSTPDGLSNVFQDNTIQVSNTVAGGDPATTTTANVCYGGDPTFEGFTGFPAGTTNCFQPNYEHDVVNYMGQNPDIARSTGQNGNPDDPAGTLLVPNFGVQPLNLQSPPFLDDTGNRLYSPVLVAGMQSLNVQLTDAGGDLGAAALHLVTNCTPAGITPGGSITGNPINPGDTSSQTQTFGFDNAAGQGASFTESVSVGEQAGTVNIPPGTIPIVTDIAIPQQIFSQLVAGTSAAPAVCLRLTAETDSFGNPMCKGFLLQCKGADGTISGDNCIPTPSTARNLFLSAAFDSPDAPSGTNFLSSACSFDLSGMLISADTCAPSGSPNTIGPGMLLGSDGWTCLAGTLPANLLTCTPAVADTHTLPSNAVYSPANCVLTGSLTGNLCPLDTLTQFLGAADPNHGSSLPGTNSIGIPVVNMPKPYTQTTIAGLTHGWVNTLTPSVTFVSNEASYASAAAPPANPSANGFAPAPPYSVTYGISTFPSVPDTTYPVAGDSTVYNTNTAPNFGSSMPPTPVCGQGGPTPNPFTPAPQPLTLGGEGIFNLHYFTTDCAFTEELLFSPKSLTDPSVNWASFVTQSFGVDTGLPSLSCSTSGTTGSNGWFTSSVNESCSATDDESGFAPGTAILGTNPPVLQGALTTNLPNVSSGATQGTFTIPAQSISDLAGNQSSVVGPSTVYIDSIAPTIAPSFSVSGTTFTVGQGVTLKDTCKDAGSGLAFCGGQPVASCPLAPSIGMSSFTTSPMVIDTSVGAVGAHMINTSAIDCAGNTKPITINYKVVFGTANLLVATVVNPSPVKTGSNLTYHIWVLDLGPNTANNVVVSTPIPAGTTFVSAIASTASCSMGGCAEIASGTPCTVVSGTVSCSIPTVKPVINLTGFVVKLVVKVTAAAGSVIKDTATVTESNPHPLAINDPSTVSTKVTN